MSIKGRIYLKSHNEEPVGIGQRWEILPINGGYAAFLTEPSDHEQFTEPWESEEECLTSLQAGGGTVIIVIEDDDF